VLVQQVSPGASPQPPLKLSPRSIYWWCWQLTHMDRPAHCVCSPSGALSSDWLVGGVGSSGDGVGSIIWRLQLTVISANTPLSAIRVTFLKFDVECDHNTITLSSQEGVDLWSGGCWWATPCTPWPHCKPPVGSLCSCPATSEASCPTVLQRSRG
jgi:hypothetical protein